MTDTDQNAAAKIHPASREVLPDDPLSLHGIEVPGDAELMLRLLVEEYARMGWNLAAIMKLAQDPFYQAFHGLYLMLGEEGLRQRVDEILSRVGISRVTTFEAEPPPVNLVQIDPPAASRNGGDHA